MTQPSIPAGPIPVLLCANGAYFQHVAVTIASLLANNRRHRFEITLATDRYYPEEEAKIQTMVDTIGNATLRVVVFGLARMQALPVRLHLTVFTYMRLFAAEIFPPDVEKILYLDTDLVVCGDIADLWATDLGNAAIAAVPDIFIDQQREGAAGQYVNAGVLLLNLKRWRAENAGAGLIAYIESHPNLPYLDQDALNAVFARRIVYLPLKWNFQARMAEAGAKMLGLTRREFREMRKNPGIVHYTTGSKPWMYAKDIHYTQLYEKYLAMTAWKDIRPQGKTLRRRLSKAVRLIKLRRKLRWIKAGL